jgi:hypothetical protein
MRARVLSFNAGVPEDLERALNDWLEKAGDIVIEESSIALANVALPVSTLVVFYKERAAIKARPAQMCAQCKKKPPLPGLKTCEECRDYQRDYRQKRKTESKTRYP